MGELIQKHGEDIFKLWVMNNQWQFCKFLAQTGPTTMSRPITRCFCSNGYLLLYSSFTKQLNCRSKSIVSFLLIFTESTLHLWWLSIEPFFLLFFDSDLYVAQFLIWSCLGFMFTSLFATISFPAWSFISRSVNNEYCQFFFFSWLHLINVDTSSFYLQFRPSVFLFFFLYYGYTSSCFGLSKLKPSLHLMTFDLSTSLLLGEGNNFKFKGNRRPTWWLCIWVLI